MYRVEVCKCGNRVFELNGVREGCTCPEGDFNKKYRLKAVSAVGSSVIQVDISITTKSLEGTGVMFTSGTKFNTNAEAEFVKKHLEEVFKLLTISVEEVDCSSGYKICCIQNNRNLVLDNYWYADIIAENIASCTSYAGTIIKSFATAEAMCNRVNKLSKRYKFKVKEATDVHNSGKAS